MMTAMLAFTGLQLAMALAIFAICVLLMMVILIQKGRGGGLTAAFGGGGGGGGAFGAKTGDAFTVITVVLAAIYLLLTVVGNFTFRPESGVAQAAGLQSQPASSGSTGAPPGAQPTGPQQLPPGAIRIDPEKLKTSAAEAIRTGTPVEENVPADKAGDAADTGADTGDAADAPGADDSGAAQPDDNQPAGDQPDDKQPESGDEQP